LHNPIILKAGDKEAQSWTEKANPTRAKAEDSARMALHPKQLLHAKTNQAGHHAVLPVVRTKPCPGPVLHHQEKTILWHAAPIKVQK
jgi:hypothetical protein